MLYQSEFTNDIFFFFNGRQENRENKVADGVFNMQVAFLNLAPTEAEKQVRANSRHIYDNVLIRKTIPQGSILEKYIDDLND